MRTAVLWTLETDYFWAAIRALEAQGNETLVVTRGRDEDSPHTLNDGGSDVRYLASPEDAELGASLEAFQPELLVVAGWHVPQFVQVSRKFRQRACRVLVLDNQWTGTIKQRAGQLLFRTKLRNVYDAALVPGPRQAAFAQRMGFDWSNISLGGIPCNSDLFQAPPTLGGRNFLTAARLVPVKGIAILLEAYSRYRSMVSDPWDLIICGVGPWPRQQIDGVRWLGFAEPRELAEHLKSSGAFVLASIFEPWGVVLHEAAAAARPIIATDACGAVGTFVFDKGNGRVVPARDAEAMAVAMTEVSLATADRRLAWGARSGSLAQRSSPEIWVDIVSGLYSTWRARTHPSPGYGIDQQRLSSNDPSPLA